MGLRINAGYIITDSLHVGDAEFVLGVSQHIPNVLSPGDASTATITGAITTAIWSAPRKIWWSARQKELQRFRTY